MLYVSNIKLNDGNNTDISFQKIVNFFRDLSDECFSVLTKEKRDFFYEFEHLDRIYISYETLQKITSNYKTQLFKVIKNKIKKTKFTEDEKIILKKIIFPENLFYSDSIEDIILNLIIDFINSNLENTVTEYNYKYTLISKLNDNLEQEYPKLKDNENITAPTLIIYPTHLELYYHITHDEFLKVFDNKPPIIKYGKQVPFEFLKILDNKPPFIRYSEEIPTVVIFSKEYLKESEDTNPNKQEEKQYITKQVFKKLILIEYAIKKFKLLLDECIFHFLLKKEIDLFEENKLKINDNHLNNLIISYTQSLVETINIKLGKEYFSEKEYAFNEKFNQKFFESFIGINSIEDILLKFLVDKIEFNFKNTLAYGSKEELISALHKYLSKIYPDLRDKYINVPKAVICPTHLELYYDITVNDFMNIFGRSIIIKYFINTPTTFIFRASDYIEKESRRYALEEYIGVNLLKQFKNLLIDKIPLFKL